jgi:tyrosyl-tRNA synthetase
MMAMAWLQRSGHRPIALAGGGTGRIGDPSGRDDERELLTDEQVEANIARIREQLSRVIDLSSPQAGVVLDNHAWLGSLGFVEFLRDVGKHFSVNQMISREAVRRRLEEREHGISYTEFSYQLLQAYDFAHLYIAEGCRLQIGGSDQWGNITAGVDLTRRLHGARVFGLVWLLLERSDGKKFSRPARRWLAADDQSLCVLPVVPQRPLMTMRQVPPAFTFLPDQIAALGRTRRKPGGPGGQQVGRRGHCIVHGMPARRGQAAPARSCSAMPRSPTRSLHLRDAFRSPVVEVLRPASSVCSTSWLGGAASSTSEAASSPRAGYT